MAQIDAFRFLYNVARLFAPAIKQGQQFTAYIGEDNSFTVLADNVLQISATEGGSFDTDLLQECSSRLAEIKSKTDELEQICSDIPAIISNLQNITYDYDYDETEAGSSELDFNMLYCRLNRTYLDWLSQFSSLRAEVLEALAIPE